MKIKLLFFLPTILLLTNSLEAQVTKHKQVSNFGIPSYIFAEMSGTFDYNYYEGKAGNYIKHGPFSIKGSQRLQQKGYNAYDYSESYSATGQYSDGYLDGTIKITRNVTNNLKKISSTWTLTMNFKDGMPHGEWKSTYASPGYPEATSHAICHFTDASMTGAVDVDWNAGWGDFSSSSIPSKMHGNLSDDSKYMGIWSVDNSEYHFEPGYLYRSIIRDGDGKLKEPGINEMEVKYLDVLHAAAIDLSQKTLTEDSAKQVYNINLKGHELLDAGSILAYFGGSKVFSRQLLNDGIRKQDGVVFYTPSDYMQIVVLPTIPDYMFQIIANHWQSKGIDHNIDFREGNASSWSRVNIERSHSKEEIMVDYKCPTCWWDDMVKYYFTDDQKNRLFQIRDSVVNEKTIKKVRDVIKDGYGITIYDTVGKSHYNKYTCIQILDFVVTDYQAGVYTKSKFSATFKGMRDNYIVEQFDVTGDVEGWHLDNTGSGDVHIYVDRNANFKYIPTIKSESLMVDQLVKKLDKYGDTVLSKVVRLAKEELFHDANAEDSVKILLIYRAMLQNTVERCAIHTDIVKKHYEIVGMLLRGYKNILKAYAAYSENIVGYFVPDNTSYYLQLSNSNKTEKLKLDQLTALCSRLQNINLEELNKSIKSEKKNPQNQQKLLLGQNF